MDIANFFKDVFFPENFKITLASTIASGGAEVAKRPVDDWYFFVMAGLFALIVAEIVLIVLKIVKLKKLKIKAFAVIPYAIATAITTKTAEYILFIEIIIFGVLYFANRFLSRRIADIEKRNNDK